jgi:hypothetical protein
MARLELNAKLGLDASRFHAVMKGAEQSAQRFGANVKASIASAFSATAAFNFARVIRDTVNRWDDLSDQLGMSVKDVQLLEAAFTKAGLGSEGAAAAALKLSAAIDDATQGGKSGDVFERLGISMTELLMKGEDTAAIMKRVAQELEGMDRVTARGFARELFGAKGGEKILAALRELRTQGGIKVVDEENVKKLADAARNIEEMQRKGIANAIPWAGDMAKEFSDNPIKSMLRGTGWFSWFMDRGLNQIPPPGEMPFNASHGRKNISLPDEDPMFSPFNRKQWELVQQLLGEDEEITGKIADLKAQGTGTPRDLGGLNELQRIGGFGGEFGGGIRDTARNTQQMSVKMDKLIQEQQKTREALAAAQDNFR